ncbi:hypothetical protein K470DRAFT_254148 [Piedraia hortae CBS 480.64]|uniref:Uncharacterized protein n=1 Tax=Piedraia hortae CBS 480.64 TaxID=1314780 RepID=A0A6A7CBW6_9PEZI|nr:hypothetical protein K470DRAFT_254148 [Piedraia hortae CBS 480.64]
MDNKHYRIGMSVLSIMAKVALNCKYFAWPMSECLEMNEASHIVLQIELTASNHSVLARFAKGFVALTVFETNTPIGPCCQLPVSSSFRPPT